TNNPLESYDKATGEGAFAVEFGATSITSGNSDELFPADSVKLHEQKITNSDINPHLKYTNMRDHGYLLLTVNDTEAIAEFKIIATRKKRDNRVRTDAIFKVNAGQTTLEKLTP
ncbi:MAG: alkaline phosphatase D family protein, partial [Bacteroidota bacterium]